jgi:hypothetical protein
MIYKHISDIRHVTSLNNGENYANLISTSAYRRRATTGTSKEDGADRWNLQAKLYARVRALCVEIPRPGYCLEAADFIGCSVMFHTNERSLCPINTRKESTRKQNSD